MVMSRRGDVPPDIFFHAQPANDLPIAHGLISKPKKYKARLGWLIRCDAGHMNGFFVKDVEERQYITRDAMDVSDVTASNDGLSLACSTCGAPVAIRVRERDQWIVRGDADWVM
jgi:hypothetical protein